MEKEIVWNCDKTFDIREFAELFYDRLPLIARIDELSDDDDVKSKSQSVCLVHSVHLQPRIVTRTEEQNNEQFVTFPYSYPFKFHVVQTDGTISEPLTVNEILQNNRRQNLKGTRIRMAHRDELTLSEVVTCDIFGTLVICGTYNEKFLLVVRLTPEGSVGNDFRLTALPTYMPLIITLPAVTVDGRPQENLEEYQRDLKDLTSAASYEENTEELLIFSHPPEDDEYEMIFPSMLLTVSDNHYDKRKSSSAELFTAEHNESSPTTRAQDNEYSQQQLLSEIKSRGSEKRVDNQDTTASEKCSLPVEAEVIYEDLPRCSFSKSSNTPGVEDDSEKGVDEHAYESYTELPESLSAEKVSEEPPPLPVKQLVGRSSAKLCRELELDLEPATVDNPSDRLVKTTVTGQQPIRGNASDRPGIDHHRDPRVPTTPPLLPGRPSLKMVKPPKSPTSSERSSEPLDQNCKTNKSPWYRFRPFRRRSTEKGKTTTGSRKSSGAACAEKKSPDNNNYLPTELNSEKVAPTALHKQPLRKSASSDRPYDQVWMTSSRWKTTDVPQTPPAVTDASNSEFPVPGGEATANKIRSNKNFLRADKRTVFNRNQTKSKTTAENTTRLEDGRNVGPMKEKTSNCDSKSTDSVTSLDASKVRPKFDRDSGFSCSDELSSCGNPRASLTTDSQITSNKDRPAIVFTTLSDVPRDLSQLTVSGVASCLRLLNLGQYVHLFRDQDVDGDLLACLDLDILMQDFGLKKFDALKLTKFVRDGWRPRTEPDNLQVIA